MISHDLRTPLTSISGNAELLLREDGRLEKTKRRQLYDDIEHDSQWLEELVENLLAMCRTIANAHGGSISVRDNVPHGCVFCLRLQKENNPDMQIGGTAS